MPTSLAIFSMIEWIDWIDWIGVSSCTASCTCHRTCFDQSMAKNGNGKTTLVKLMLGELKPVEGEVRAHAQARIALVNQVRREAVDYI